MLGDSANQLYLVGGMGGASALGLGLALLRLERRVIVPDGGGAVLMRMGNLAMVGAHASRNLLHLELDNEAHDSTGAQATLSRGVAFGGSRKRAVTREPWARIRRTCWRRNCRRPRRGADRRWCISARARERSRNSVAQKSRHTKPNSN